MNKIGGRKFTAVIIMAIIGAIMELKLPTGLSPTMAAFLGGLLTVFTGGNAMAAITAAKAGGSSPAADDTGDMKLLAEAVMSLDNKLDAMTNNPDNATGINALVEMNQTMSGLVESVKGLQKLILNALGKGTVSE